MSNPEPASRPAPPPRPGWVDRLLKFLTTEDNAETPAPSPAPAPVAPPPVVKRTRAGDVYHL
jgi:hypothetical protein